MEFNRTDSFENDRSAVSLTYFDWPIVDPPKVGVIIPHYNYASLVEEAICSVRDQTYDRLECVVVDDCSRKEDAEILRSIASRYTDTAKLIENAENIGQILSFYKGVSQIDADFYCILDPDDRYFPTFIEEMVAIHLNPYIYVPMVCCDQFFIVNGRQVTGTRLNIRSEDEFVGIDVSQPTPKTLNYYSYGASNWPWTSTSSMMFRKDFLELLAPPQKQFPAKSQGDQYLANGARFLGGTIVYNKALVKRLVHNKNIFRNPMIIASKEKEGQFHLPGRTKRLKELALINSLENGALDSFNERYFKKVLRKTLKLSGILYIKKETSKAKGIITIRFILGYLFLKLKFWKSKK